MALFKQTWQFQSDPGGNWNEVLYVQDETLESARPASKIVTARLRLLHTHNILKRIRVSDVGNPRVATFFTLNLSGRAIDQPLVEGDNPPANIDEAAVCILGSTAVPSSRKVWMRGIREDAIVRNTITGIGTPAPFFSELLDNWFKALVGDGTYVVNAHTRVAGDKSNVGFIKSIDGATFPGYSIITTVQPLTPVAGQMMTFNSVDQKLFPGLKGQFQIVSVAGQLFTIKYRVPRDFLDANIKQGYCLPYARRLGAFLHKDVCKFGYLGSRRSKNVDTGSRGARRAQRLRK